MAPDSPLSAVAHAIQLSVSPVFLLMALGTFLNVLSLRLGRVVDRARSLEKSAPDGLAINAPELTILRRRRKLVNVAITFATFAALLVCLLIACAFIGAMVELDVSAVIAALFIISMFAFIGVLLAFLAEIRLSAWYTPLDPK
jgi:hypothetical protein